MIDPATHCSIIMLRDEADILEEWLTQHTKFFKNLFILDGSDDATFEKERAIFDKFAPYIKFLVRDRSTGYQGKARDGWRKILLEQVHKQGFSNSWVAVAHPDEFYTGDPNEAFEHASKNNMDNITVLVNIFFLHTSQKDSWSFQPGDSIQQKAKYYAYPGHPEYRFFKNNPNTQYIETKHSWVMPDGINHHIYHWDKTLKAYTWRNPDQFIKRSQGRVTDGWQVHSKHYFDGMQGTVFRDALTPAEGAEVRCTDQFPLPII